MPQSPPACIPSPPACGRSSPACIPSPPPCSAVFAGLHSVTAALLAILASLHSRTATLLGAHRQPAFGDRQPVGGPRRLDFLAAFKLCRLQSVDFSTSLELFYA